METSAKANINIENAFYELAAAILTKTCGREQTEALDRVPLEGRHERQSNRCCWAFLTAFLHSIDSTNICPSAQGCCRSPLKVRHFHIIAVDLRL